MIIVNWVCQKCCNTSIQINPDSGNSLFNWLHFPFANSLLLQCILQFDLQFDLLLGFLFDFLWFLFDLWLSRSPKRNLLIVHDTIIEFRISPSSLASLHAVIIYPIVIVILLVSLHYKVHCLNISKTLGQETLNNGRIVQKLRFHSVVFFSKVYIHSRYCWFDLLNGFFVLLIPV